MFTTYFYCLSWHRKTNIQSWYALHGKGQQPSVPSIKQCDGSGMFIPDPSRIQDPLFTHPGSRTPDPGSQIQKQVEKRGVEKNFVKHFFVATNFPKCKIILFLNCSRFGPNFKELLNFSPKKLSLSSQKYEFRIRDPRSGIRNKPIPDPGSRGQKGTQSRIPDPQHCYQESFLWSEPQENYLYRGPTELVQHFAYRGSSHRRKSAVRHITDMLWLYRSHIPVGRRGQFTCSNDF